MSAQDFVREILVRRLGARHVIVGHGFLFGKKKAGNLKTLLRLGEEHGFATHGLPTVRLASIAVSSSKIREFTMLGRVGGASLFLGRDFLIEGHVTVGKARGRSIGIPTANLQPENEIIPRRGVYAGWAQLQDGAIYKTVINIGTNPTFEKADQLNIEAHLLNFSGDLYHQRLRLYFTQRLRDERRFSSAEELVEAIHHDIGEAELLLHEPAIALKPLDTTCQLAAG
jgi:riboflavin kinase/FMN adenylyltransferase